MACCCCMLARGMGTSCLRVGWLLGWNCELRACHAICKARASWPRSHGRVRYFTSRHNPENKTSLPIPPWHQSNRQRAKRTIAATASMPWSGMLERSLGRMALFVAFRERCQKMSSPSSKKLKMMMPTSMPLL